MVTFYVEFYQIDWYFIKVKTKDYIYYLWFKVDYTHKHGQIWLIVGPMPIKQPYLDTKYMRFVRVYTKITLWLKNFKSYDETVIDWSR